MTQEDKELLLKDLCAKLPYGIKCKNQYGEYIDVNIYNAHIEHLIDQIVSGVVQMVLRPMSSMTKDEREYIEELSEFRCILGYALHKINFCLEHHLDCNDLIKKGLALEAPEGMYNIKEK